MTRRPFETVAARPPQGSGTVPVSWVAATWVVPVVPAACFLGFLLAAGGTDVGGGQSSDYATALVISTVIALVGAGLTRVGGAGVRGVGCGLLAGGLACVVPSLWVLVT